MAIISAQLTKDGASGDFPFSGERTYSATWQIICDTPNQDAAQIVIDSVGAGVPDYGVPFIGLSGITDYFSAVVKKTVKRDSASKYRWWLECEYAPSTGRDAKNLVDDPVQQPPVYSWSSSSLSLVADKDDDGKQIRNSAKCAFNPQPEIDEPLLILDYQRNIAYDKYDPTKAVKFFGAVNKTSFLGFEPRQAKIMSWGATIQYTSSPFRPQYWDSSIQIAFREQTWDLKILDQGFRRLEGGKPVEILVDNDETPPAKVRPTEPLLLDGNGQILAAEADSVYLKFKPYPVKEFADLGISL